MQNIPAFFSSCNSIDVATNLKNEINKTHSGKILNKTSQYRLVFQYYF